MHWGSEGFTGCKRIKLSSESIQHQAFCVDTTDSMGHFLIGKLQAKIQKLSQTLNTYRFRFDNNCLA